MIGGCLQKFFPKFPPWQIKWKGVLLESILFLVIYLTWVIFRSPQSPSRLLVGSLSVLAPAVTSAILVFRSLGYIPVYSRRAWQFFGLGLICWAAGSAVRTFYEGIQGSALPIFSIADIFNFLAYPFLFSALISFPFENHYAPSWFRFLLDSLISSGAAAALGWLMLGRSVTLSSIDQLAPLVYPIADLILLMILLNMLLANRNARPTLLLWGIGLLGVFVSNYLYSLLAPANGYQAGGLESIGWTLGSLLFGVGVVYFAFAQTKEAGKTEQELDLGNRIQNILPITLVLALCWFILFDWRVSGRPSSVGVWMALFLAIALVVRLGVRAGEVELNKYWQIFSNIAEPTFICDGKGKILLGNPALARTLDLGDEYQIIGKSLITIFDEQTLPHDLFQRAAQNDYSFEVQLRPHRTPYLLTLSPIFSEGRRVLLAGAAHNLSDQKHQQQAIQTAYDELHLVYSKLENLNAQLEEKVQERTRTLSEALDQLEEKNKLLQVLDQLKSDFVSMVSHELRTPLTSLNGGLELLLNQKDRPRTDRNTLLLMKNEVQRLTHFVENILNLSAMEAGRIEVNLMPLSLSAVIEVVCNKLNTIPGVERIQVDSLDDIPKIVADEMILQSIFNHLLDNAIKYAPEGPIMINAIRLGKKIRVQVTDSGPGIPKEKRALLFHRFQRLDVKDSQSVYGYGLGLYISQRMLRAMQSELGFEAPPEGGARFFFDLKVAQ
jgi:PAS domain S-box-containing protein